MLIVITTDMHVHIGDVNVCECYFWSVTILQLDDECYVVQHISRGIASRDCELWTQH